MHRIDLLSETELVASQPVYELSMRFQDATSAVLRRLISETERRVPDGQSGDAATFAAVRAAMRRELAEQRTGEIYAELRQQMRSELFDLALDPHLRPTQEEQDALREEVKRLAGDSLN